MAKKHADKMIPRLPVKQGGREKMERILECTEQLLMEKSAEDISIYDIADLSGLAAQTIYRIFPSPASACFALANRYLDEVVRFQGNSSIYEECRTWQEAVVVGFTSMRDYFRAHPQAMGLMFGSGTSREIKAADREWVRNLAEELISILIDLKLITELPNMVTYFLIAIEINDAIWSVSYDHHKDITDFYMEESIRAVTAYINLYLPSYQTATYID
ncbi:hypothetical protein DSLASN_45640 [Desulfoluna limicola]|uniref:HTH tetR-type domain-containing protein n=1 Tax=Desulfoluna limicola TaxID=2810562 RepID=A0ABN6FBN4_9BACT|nr:TetR/AcrR family transcriptional regulator [Desulfoluna limicola]BCS98932.1 hypothetical protein DSLASN_45640 [Desulfoluna limicola]